MHTLHTDLATARTAAAPVITACADAARYINAAIRLRDTFKDGVANASGDTQSALDLTADRLLADHLRASGIVHTIASEERDDLLTIADARGDFFVAYDPYDGGSVGDVNITFGSIIGIWSRNPLADAAPLDAHLVAACAVLYGPRVTLLLALPGNAPTLYELDEVGTFVRVRTDLRIAPDARTFAPGNLRATRDLPQYATLVQHWIDSNLTLRYSGALVTDINHIVLKGNGIFTYPEDADHPHGRLRLLYEGAPLALVVESAGGSATTSDGTRILDIIAETTHQRTPLLFGSTATVTHAIATLRNRENAM